VEQRNQPIRIAGKLQGARISQIFPLAADSSLEEATEKASRDADGANENSTEEEQRAFVVETTHPAATGVSQVDAKNEKW